MMKLFGAFCVGTASLMIGGMSRQGLNSHIHLLRQIRLALEIMQGEMELNMPHLNRLFETVGERTGGEAGSFFQQVGVKMTQSPGRPPVMAMRLALEEVPLSLNREEKGMLFELGGALGRYDLIGQGRAIGLYKTRLDSLIEAAEGERKQKAKAWMTASVCSGLMLILLML